MVLQMNNGELHHIHYAAGLEKTACNTGNMLDGR